MFVCIEVSDTYILVNSYIILIITLEKHADSKYLAQTGWRRTIRNPNNKPVVPKRTNRTCLHVSVRCHHLRSRLFSFGWLRITFFLAYTITENAISSVQNSTGGVGQIIGFIIRFVTIDLFSFSLFPFRLSDNVPPVKCDMSLLHVSFFLFLSQPHGNASGIVARVPEKWL